MEAALFDFFLTASGQKAVFVFVLIDDIVNDATSAHSIGAFLPSKVTRFADCANNVAIWRE